MSKFDENLFSRLAVLNNYVGKKELEECLEIQKDRGSKQHIGHILREQGYLTDEQFQRIVEIRRKKVRKLLRSREDSLENDREFGKLVLHEQLIDLDALEAAVLEQQQLRRLNLHFSLTEVLVSRKQIDVETAKRLLILQGHAILRCAVCDVQYQIVDFEEGKYYRCPRCRSSLDSPAFLDPLMVEGVVEVEDGVAEDIVRDAAS